MKIGRRGENKRSGGSNEKKWLSAALYRHQHRHHGRIGGIARRHHRRKHQLAAAGNGSISVMAAYQRGGVAQNMLYENIKIVWRQYQALSALAIIGKNKWRSAAAPCSFLAARHRARRIILARASRRDGA